MPKKGLVFHTKSGLVLLFIVVVVVLIATACDSSESSVDYRPDSSGDNSTLSRVALEVPTIWCFTCQPRVEASAKSVSGVTDVKFDDQTVIITYDSTQTSPEAIIQAIERGGDRVTKVTDL